MALCLATLFLVGCGSEDGPPSSWEAELSDALTPQDKNSGKLHIIAWEEHESDFQGKISRRESAIVVKERDGPKFGFVYASMHRNPSSAAEVLRDWHLGIIISSGVPPNPGTDEILRYQSDERPDNQEIYEKFWTWNFSDRRLAFNPDGSGILIVPRSDLVRGGVDRAAWREATGEEPERIYSDPPRNDSPVGRVDD